MATAIRPTVTMRGVAVKSPSRRDVPGTLCMLRTPAAAMGALLEEHRRFAVGGIHGASEGGERGRESPPPGRRQFANALDEALLRRIGRSGHQLPPPRCQVQLNRASVV